MVYGATKIFKVILGKVFIKIKVLEVYFRNFGKMEIIIIKKILTPDPQYRPRHGALVSFPSNSSK